VNSQLHINKTGPAAILQALLRVSISVFVVGMLGKQATASAAAPPPPAAVSNAVLKSVFVIPSGPPEGKDPFFPKSIRVYTEAAPKTTPILTNAAPQNFELKLSGVSGTAERPLAIINGKTFEQGEEGEVRVGGGRINIRVVEIKGKTVMVQIGAQQQVLRLRDNY
jgi:hypothetical protein